MVPNARRISDEELATMQHFAAIGRKLIITEQTGQGFQQILSKSYAAAASAASSIPQIEDALTRFETDVLKNSGAGRRVSIQASPFVISQIASVDGKLHIFLSNFKGVVAKQNPAPKPESDVVIEFPNSAGSRMFALPYLGERIELAARVSRNKLIVNVPAFTRNIVVWQE